MKLVVKRPEGDPENLRPYQRLPLVLWEDILLRVWDGNREAATLGRGIETSTKGGEAMPDDGEDDPALQMKVHPVHL